MTRAQSAGFWRSPAIAVLVVTAFLGCGGKDDSAELGADAGHRGLCGNGKLDKGEACDGTNFGGETCASLTMAVSPAGTPRCAEDCESIITDGCTGGGGEGGSGATSGAGATSGSGATTGIGGSGATTGIGGTGATTGIGGAGGRRGGGGTGGTLGRGTPG